MVLAPVRLFPPPPANGNGDVWAALRRRIGARPAGLVQFPTHRSRLDDLRPGEQLLLIRKYGGLGDILISSMLFPMVADQYPDIRVTYACPRAFHHLFDGSGLRLLAYEDVWSRREIDRHRGSVRPEILGRFDLIEDISVPCHLWENFFVAHGGIDPGSRLKWRNRLDMWARWFGLQVQNPRTNIRIRDEERAAARRLLVELAGTDRPVCLLAPFSYSRMKNYPWSEALAGRLQAEGWAVLLLHNRAIPSGIPTLADLSFRMMGAACAAADLIVAVDTAAFHWGGILGRTTIGIFNVNDGAAYCRYYPTARFVQTCAQPCINVRYGPGEGTCPLHGRESLPAIQSRGLLMSRCYPRFTIDSIMEAVRATGCRT